MNIKLKSMLLLVVSPLIFSCTWVNLTDAAQKVRVLEMSEVGSCQKKGQTVASVKDKILGMDRTEKKVEKELETIARNEAPEMNADTIVPVTPVKDGQRKFYLYKCVDPNH